MKLIRAITTISGWTALSRILGLGREILMSHILGAGLVVDAFVVAFKLPNFFRRLFGEGALNAAFVPIFSQHLVKEGRESARFAAEQVMSFLGFFLSLVTLLVLLFTPQLLPVLAPGFASTPERLQMATDFTRMTFPYVIFICLTALQTGVLNSLDRFAAGAAAPIVLNVVMIGALMGYSLTHLEPGYVLSISVFMAGLMQFAFLYYASWRAGMCLRFRWPRLTAEVKLVLRKMLPGIVGAGVMQINLLIDMVLASLLPQGSMSYLHYADRLNQLPLSVFGIAIGTALLPKLSKLIQEKQMDQARQTQESALEIALQLSMPAAVGLAVLSYPIISLIYGHGQFNTSDVLATAPTLAAFSIGLPAYVMNKVLTTNFFARQDTKTPMKIAIFCVGLNFLLNLALMWPLKHVGMALATSLSAWVQTGILLYVLKRAHQPTFSWALKMRTLRVGFVCLCMALALFYLQRVLSSPMTLSREFQHLGLLILSGFMLFLVLGHYLKAYDVRQLKQMMKKT